MLNNSTKMAELETRRLGRTEMKPKALGLGCAFLGSPQRVDEDGAIETVRYAIDQGINFVDTSAGYGGGESERRVGLALEDGYRQKVYLQTKAGTHPERRNDYSAAGIRWSVENSLRRLRADFIDSVLIHDPRDEDNPLAPGAALDTLLELKEEGVIGHVGIGVRSHEWHRKAIETGHCEILITFLDYTLINQSATETIIPLALKNDVGVILASVQGMGLLAGPEPDPEIEERHHPGQGHLAHDIWQWCQQRDVNIRQLALGFCLNAPLYGNGMVLAGPANKREAQEVLEAATTPLPREVWREFKDRFGVGV